MPARRLKYPRRATELRTACRREQVRGTGAHRMQASDKPYAGALPRRMAMNRDAVHLHRCDGPVARGARQSSCSVRISCSTHCCLSRWRRLSKSKVGLVAQTVTSPDEGERLQRLHSCRRGRRDEGQQRVEKVSSRPPDTITRPTPPVASPMAQGSGPAAPAVLAQRTVGVRRRFSRFPPRISATPSAVNRSTRSAYTAQPAAAVSGTRRKSIGTTTVASACCIAWAKQ